MKSMTRLILACFCISSFLGVSASGYCELSETRQVLRRSLPPGASVTQNASGNIFLDYSGTVPLVFFRKESTPIRTLKGDEQLLKDLPTQPDEMPLARLMAGRLFLFYLTGMPVAGKEDLKGWQLQPYTGYPFIQGYPPDVPADIIEKIVQGNLKQFQAVAQQPYYFGKELRQIEIEYTFTKDPSYDPSKGCQIRR